MSGKTLTRGKEVELFKTEFAKYIGAKHAISIGSYWATLTRAEKNENWL